MADFDFDLFVIGGGSGGVRAARMTADTGARVGLAEEYRIGGTCVIRGCVPKKLFVYAAGFAEAFEDAEGYGWEVESHRFDWARFKSSRDAEVNRLEGIYGTVADRAGVRRFTSRAVLTGPHGVRLATGEAFTARHILIATGGRPALPGIPGEAHAITSDGVFDLPTQPRRIAIVGGGYIACEFAGIFNGLGTETTIIQRGESILRVFDEDVRSLVQGAMADKGVAFRLGVTPVRLDRTADGLSLHLSDGDVVEADVVLIATGRVPNTRDLGLEEAGVATGPLGTVTVDRWSQTNVPSVYAVGDVTGRIALTPIAIRDAMAFVETVFRANPTPVDHHIVPTAIFTQPEIGTVGLTEAEARAAGPLTIYRTSFRPMLHTLTGRGERNLMKLVVASDTRRVVGVHIVGHAAGEMIQLAGVAMTMGATKEDFDRTLAVHPTAAEELVTLRQPSG